jgi:sugar/nucleoside kinase (ribokinase family)
MQQYDITFIGHICFDEIEPYRAKRYIAPGSAVLQGAMAAAGIGKRTMMVTKMAPKDEPILDSLKEKGVYCHLIPADETSWMYVGHPSPNVDEREMILKHNAGPFSINEIPGIKTSWYHMAGISNQEFRPDFIRALKKRGVHISIDMQSFVRQVHPETHEVSYGDDDRKQEIVSMMDRLKLDVVEAEILTGTSDLEKASKILLNWGCPEVVITKSDGVLANVDGKVMWEPFTNNSVVGRTGRGDTTFAGYLAARFENDPEWSLKFAASLVSIKMESVGPFNGAFEDVLERMKIDGRI